MSEPNDPPDESEPEFVSDWPITERILSVVVEFTDSTPGTVISDAEISFESDDPYSDSDGGLGLPVPAPGPNKPKTGPAAARLPIPQTESNH